MLHDFLILGLKTEDELKKKFQGLFGHRFDFSFDNASHFVHKVHLISSLIHIWERHDLEGNWSDLMTPIKRCYDKKMTLLPNISLHVS